MIDSAGEPDESAKRRSNALGAHGYVLVIPYPTLRLISTLCERHCYTSPTIYRLACLYLLRYNGDPARLCLGNDAFT